MSRSIFTPMAALLYVCLLLAVVGSAPAPPKRPVAKELKIVQEKTIIVRRMPNAHFFYPFSLWPLPKYQSIDNEDGFQKLPYRSLQNAQRRWNER